MRERDIDVDDGLADDIAEASDEIREAAEAAWEAAVREAERERWDRINEELGV